MRSNPHEASVSPLVAWLRNARELVWRLIVTTVGGCLRYRVTGLAAEAAFFAVLSVPPLIFAMAGAIGYVSDQFSAAQVDDVRDAVIDLSSRALTENAVDRIITPTINDVLAAAAGSTSSRSASCSPCGPAPAPSTSSWTRSRSCTGSAATAGS